MRPTQKWNEELPLHPRKRTPPTKRYRIVVDNGKPVIVQISPQAAGGGAPMPRYQKTVSEIHGASLREDELREYAHELGSSSLIWNGRDLARPEEQMGFTVPLRAHLPRKKKARRRGPLNVKALARGIRSGKFVMGADGSVYAQDEMGLFKKIGKVVKKGAKTVAKPVAKVAKPVVKVHTAVAKPIVKAHMAVIKPVAKGTMVVARPVARGTATVAKPVAKVAVKTAKTALSTTAKVAAAAAKLSTKGIVEVARALASAAAQPIRLAFAASIGRPRAAYVARSQGRSAPNSTDKKQAVLWGFSQLKSKMPKGLGAITVKILEFSRGASLSGMHGHVVGVVDPATISAYSAAIIAAMAALSKTLKFGEGLKASVTVSPSAETTQQPQQEASPEAPSYEAPSYEAPAPTYETPAEPEQTQSYYQPEQTQYYPEPSYETPSYEQQSYEPQSYQEQSYYEEPAATPDYSEYEY